MQATTPTGTPTSAISPADSCSPVERARLSFLDRYLTLWIFAAMAIGVGLGRFVPSFDYALPRLYLGTTCFPTAMDFIVRLLLLLANVANEELGRVLRDTHVLVVDVIQDRIVSCVLIWGLRIVILPGVGEYVTCL